MISEEKRMKTQYKILTENHEILRRDYESLQEWMKHSEEVYNMYKWLHQKEAKELKLENTHLLEELQRERMEKDKYKEMVEVMQTTESERTNEMKKKDKELLLTKEKLMKLEDTYVELAEKFGVVEAKLANKGTLSPVMSGIGENKVNQNVNNNNNNATTTENIGEHDKPQGLSNNIPMQEPRNQGHRNTVSEESVVPKIYVAFDVSSSSSSSTYPSLVFLRG